MGEIDAMPGARVGSVIGRYWAMDRDSRWERTQRAYDLLVHGRAAHHADTGEQAVRDAYERGETDEFIEPTLVGEPAVIGTQDSVIAFNFRPDRMRQLTRALAELDFGEQAQTGAGGGSGREGGQQPERDGDLGAELPGWDGRRGAGPLYRYTTL